MKFKKIIAAVSAITLTFSVVSGCFPAFTSEKHTVRAMAEEFDLSDAAKLFSLAEEEKTAKETLTTDDGWNYYNESGQAVINGYSGTLTELVVPEEIDGLTVTAIANQAFKGNTKIKSIDLGSVKKIGYQAFSGCTALKEITIPKTVTEAGSSYYEDRGCLDGSSVETVTFEKGIAKIPNYVCYGASSVKNVILPEKEDTLDGYAIGDDAFRGTSLSSVTIPESVTAINDRAFMDCALLTELTVPDNVTLIGNEAFSGCKRLKNLHIGASVSEIGYRAFRNCVSISGIDLANTKKIGYQAFSGCTALKEITIPKTVTEAGSSYYEDRGSLDGSSVETVTFEKGIAKIPNYVCYGASSVKNVILPEKEDTLDGYSIGDDAFRGTSLSSITIPESVTDINDRAFMDCALLTELTVPDNVTWIGNEAFSGCKRLKNIHIGASVSEIGYKAFRNCVSISGIDLANTKKIGYQAFSGCTALKEITIPKTVTEAGSSYYEDRGCLDGSSVETVTFEKGIAKIPNYVCYGASSVKNVILPEKEDTLDGYAIGDDAFRGTSLSSVTIPESVTAINDRAFMDCALLTELTVPDNVTLIGNEAFSGCKRLKNLHIGASVSEIGYRAFRNCVSISGIDLANTKKIGYQAFSGCTALKEITVPKTVTEAGSSYYEDRGSLDGSSIETVTFEAGSKTVPNNFAYGCTSLRKVYLPDTVSSIGDRAFAECSNLDEIKSTRTLFTFSAHSFDGCEALDDSRFTVFDSDNTYLVSNSELASVNGIVNYKLKYKLMPSVASSAKDLELVLNVPDGMTLLLDSIQSPDLSFDPEKINNGTIPVSQTSGELSFTARVSEIGDYHVSAVLKFDYNDSTWEQYIGRLDVECPDLTCDTLENTSSYDINVHGIADRGAKVEIYVDGKLAGDTLANQYTGKYAVNITLPKKASGSTYSINAVCNDKTTEPIDVVYGADLPQIRSVTMVYNGGEKLDITNVFTEGASPVVSYNPAANLAFEIAADNSEQIRKLFVTSKKGRSEKRLEAFWDEDKQLWVTEGYFDENNHSYIPGTLNIALQTIDSIQAAAEENLFDPRKLEPDKNAVANSYSEIIEQNDNETLEKVVISNGVESEELYHYCSSSDTLKIGDKELSAKEIASESNQLGFVKTSFRDPVSNLLRDVYIKPITGKDIANESDIGKQAERFDDMYGMIFVDPGDSMEASIVKEVWKNTIPENVVKITFGKEASQAYGTLGSSVSFVSATAKYYDNYVNKATDDNGRSLANLMYAYSTSSICIGMMITSINPLAGIAWGIATGVIGAYLEKRLDEYYKNGGNVRFGIDPSGIVYEAVPGNTVEGATVTIYYRDPETGDTVKWNAEDYEQLNPLLTDKDGKYLWDVPEGEWKVVCEKEGYETSESEWLSVPPVRTDVNFALVNKEAPVLVSAENGGDGLIVKLSRFVDISTVTADTLTVEGTNGEYTITPQLLDENDQYADTFVISGKSISDAKSVSVSDKIKSYAGIAAEKSTAALTSSTNTLGDLNNDGKVDAKDASIVLTAYAKVSTGADDGLTEEEKAAANVNADEKIDAKDASFILSYYSLASTSSEEVPSMEEYMASLAA